MNSCHSDYHKGQNSMLCPYWVDEGKLFLYCDNERFMFEDQASKTKYRNSHCRNAMPKNCPRYMKHYEAAKRGEERLKQPKEMMDRSEQIRMRERARKKREEMKKARAE